MHKSMTTGGMKILMTAAVIAGTAVMILSAYAASAMYLPTRDIFSSSLCKNLATLCENADYGLSATQLGMIENAEIKSIRYDSDQDGKKIFSAKLKLSAPADNVGSYSNENPVQYLKEVSDTIYGGQSVEIDVIGLCDSDQGNNIPTVDMETLQRIAETADEIWKKETLSQSRSFEYALTDFIIPEPFPDRAFTDGGIYQSSYTAWLDECAQQFAAEGLKVTADGGKSGEISDIRAVMEQIVTPYLCSVRNVSLSRSEEKKGVLCLSFDTLDVIGTLYAANKPSVPALNKLCGVYSDERALKVTVDIDPAEIAGMLNGKDRAKLPFFDIIRAMTRYASSIGKPLTKVKTPESTQVIGKSDGQWPIEFKRAKGDGNIVVNVIRIENTGEEKSVLKIFLTDGGKTTVCLKQGKYRLYYAVGTTYYGSSDFFGSNGIYMKDDNVFTLPSTDLKTITVAKQPAESLSFTDYLIKQGVDPALIDWSDF